MRARKPSPAMAVALLALFVALGGSSYAAITLSKNSVRSKHIVNGQVKRPDIAKGAVTSAKVQDFSLLAEDFKTGQLRAGPQGPKGEKGDQGPTGEPSNAYSASNDYSAIGADDTTLVSVDVPAGSYTLAAKTHLYNTVTDSFAICELRGAGAVIDDSTNRLIAPANDQVVPFLGAAMLLDGGTIALVCNGNGVTSVESEDTKLVATSVGAVH